MYSMRDNLTPVTAKQLIEANVQQKPQYTNLVNAGGLIDVGKTIKALISTTKPCDGNRNWINDTYCDDNNNNVECQWDGGDCCNNMKIGWNNYCTACKCLDPNNQA